MTVADGAVQVVEKDGRYWCESDGKFYDRCVRRYVFSVQVVDASGEAYVNVYNEQARQMLRMFYAA